MRVVGDKKNEPIKLRDSLFVVARCEVARKVADRSNLLAGEEQVSLY